MLGGVAISRRCLLPCLLIACAALAPLAGAGSSHETRLQVTTPDDVIDVPLGERALVDVGFRNADQLLSHTINFTAVTLPAGWTFTFTPDRLVLEPGANATTRLLLSPPPDVAAGGPLNFTFDARETSNSISSATPASARFWVLIRVLPPPPASDESPTPPRLFMGASDTSGAAGSRVEGALVFIVNDTRRLETDLAIDGAPEWLPALHHTFHVLDPETKTVRIPLYASIPSSAQVGDATTFTVRATALGHEITAPWTVRVDAPAATPAEPEPDTTEPAPEPNDDATPPDDGGPDADTPPDRPLTAGLQLALDAEEFETHPGGKIATFVTVSNTGDTTLTVRLGGNAPVTWPPLVYETDVITLQPRQTREIGLTIEAPADVVPGALGMGAAAVTNDDGLLRSVRFAVRVAEPPVVLDPPQDDRAPTATQSGDGATISIPTEWGVAAGVATIGAGALVLARRPMREKLLWGAIGLYTRLARPDVLGHDEREKLYRLIETSPGTHFHALQRELGWNTGTLTYHLRVLEKHGFVVSRRDGLYRRFYLQGAAPRKETFTDGPTGLRADVLEAIRGQQGMSQTDLALALGANKQTVNYHVKALERQGLIRVEKRGRETFLYASPPAGTDDRARASA